MSNDNDKIFCPNCNKEIKSGLEIFEGVNYCSNCKKCSKSKNTNQLIEEEDERRRKERERETLENHRKHMRTRPPLIGGVNNIYNLDKFNGWGEIFDNSILDDKNPTENIFTDSQSTEEIEPSQEQQTDSDIISSILSDSITPIETVFQLDTSQALLAQRDVRPFRYWKYFETFCQDLADILYDIDKISKNSIDVVSRYIANDNEKLNLLNKLTAMRDGTLLPSKRGRFENFLDKIYARLLLKLDDSISEEIEKLLEKVFSNIYLTLGFEKKNIFYRKSKILLYQLAIILNNFHSLNGESLISSDSLNSLTNEFFIDNYRYNFFYEKMDRNNPIPQSIPNIKNLQVRTINSINALLNNNIIDFRMKQKLENLILPLIQNYLNNARNYRNLITHFEEKKKAYEENSNINRIKLIEMIYNSHSAFLAIDTQSRFSKLLFGRTDYIDTLFFNNIESRPNLSTLYRIIYNSLFWRDKDFDFQIGDLELNLIKDKISKIIEDFVFSDAYPDDPYIPPTITRFGMSFSKDYLKSEYQLTTIVWLAMALHEGDPKFNWEKAFSKYNIAPQGILLNKQNRNIGMGILRRVLEITNTFIKELSISSIKMEIYTDVISSVKLYAANRYLALDGLSYNERRENNYHELFNDPRIVGTNIIMHLLMYAGINPYNGRFLKPELFDGVSDTGIFGRHHLFELDKQLFACGETITLPRSFHNSIEFLSRTQVGKNIQKKLLSAVNYLVLKNTIITPADIDYYLGEIEISSGNDNISIADLWKGNRTPQELNNFLNKWNKARNNIKKSRFYDMLNENFELENGENPIIDKYWSTAQNVITVYTMIKNFDDFSYLFTQSDQEFLKKLWKI
ncbi:MAG TPA: zinc ribbon domain-containing protein [archaeon]|nr:zinc ribbon domain-containing protein [archaeon]